MKKLIFSLVVVMLLAVSMASAQSLIKNGWQARYLTGIDTIDDDPRFSYGGDYGNSWAWYKYEKEFLTSSETASVLVLKPEDINFNSFLKNFSGKFNGKFRDNSELGLKVGKNISSVSLSSKYQVGGPTDADRLVIYVNDYIIEIFTKDIFLSKEIDECAYIVNGNFEIYNRSMDYYRRGEIIGGQLLLNYPLKTRYLNLGTNPDIYYNDISYIEVRDLKLKWN